jgi:glycosyltransferase involved in cell wall biosynthesis
MKIGLLGPVATEDIVDLLDDAVDELDPIGYQGAPFLGCLIREYLRAGHDVAVYTTDEGLDPARREPIVRHGPGLTVHYVPRRSTSIRPCRGHLGRCVDFFSLERRHLLSALCLNRPTVLHAHWAYEFGLAAIASGLPHLLTCHDSPRQVLRHAKNYYRLVRYAMGLSSMRRAQAVSAVSPYMAKELESMTGRKFLVIPNPVDNAVFEMPPRVRGAQSNAWVVLMATNGWSMLKNGRAALAGFANVSRHYPQARLRCFGADFGEGQVAHQWARANGFDHGVEFCGRVCHRELLTAMHQADAVLHPSREESFCMAVAEALALGIPVLAGRDSGAIPWLLDGGGGCLVDVRDPAAIAEGLLYLLRAAPQGPEAVAAGRARVRERFAARTVAMQYLAALEEVSRAN